jgi:hypothetical protein
VRSKAVGIDYHVEVERQFYSVPYRFARAEVEVRLTGRTVEVFARVERIAVHMRSSGNGKHTTIADHMPSSHRRYADWTIGRSAATPPSSARPPPRSAISSWSSDPTQSWASDPASVSISPATACDAHASTGQSSEAPDPGDIMSEHRATSSARWTLGKLLRKVVRGAGPGRGKKKGQPGPSFKGELAALAGA